MYLRLSPQPQWRAKRSTSSSVSMGHSLSSRIADLLHSPPHHPLDPAQQHVAAGDVCPVPALADQSPALVSLGILGRVALLYERDRLRMDRGLLAQVVPPASRRVVDGPNASLNRLHRRSPVLPAGSLRCAQTRRRYGSPPGLTGGCRYTPRRPRRRPPA